MKLIHKRAELVELAKQLGTRPDWHEPDEQDLTAEVHGASFDNAGFWPEDEHRAYTAPEVIEQHVILYQEGQPVAAVNLATLFAWATGYEVPSPSKQQNLDLVRRVQKFGNDVADAASSDPRGGFAALIVADITRRVTAEIVKMIERDDK